MEENVVLDIDEETIAITRDILARIEQHQQSQRQSINNPPPAPDDLRNTTSQPVENTIHTSVLVECSICVEKYNKRARLPVVCSYCDFAACRVCCETYLLSESVPKCMNPSCAKEWSRKFLRDSFTHVFIAGKYRDHCAAILFDKERALMPTTQVYVERAIEAETIQKHMDQISNEIQRLHHQYGTLRDRKHALIYPSMRQNAELEAAAAAAKFVRSCPADGCRGFLSTQWKCGLCSLWTCSACHVVKGSERDTEHTCDPNLVATAELLARDSKPCPKCHVFIFKISGCDQMWCTQCHTAFSWRTGAVENNIHNPHYYEWMRLTQGSVPRAPGDNPGGGECNRGECNQLTHALGRSITQRFEQRWTTDVSGVDTTALYKKLVHRVVRIVQNSIHILHVVAPKYRLDDRPDEQRNRDMRISYMRSKMTDDEFKHVLEQQNRTRERYREYNNVFTTYLTVMTELAWRFYRDLLEPVFPHEIETEIDALLTYINDCLRDTSRCYKTVLYQIGTCAEMD